MKIDLFNRKKVEALSDELTNRESDFNLRMNGLKAQMLLIDDVLTARAESTGRYKGNNYTNLRSALNEIVKKYKAEADWGVIQTGNIIDLRASFIIGQGINIVDKTTGEDNADREIAWANKFLEFNGLDGIIAQQFATEAEIEGRFLGQLHMLETEEPYTLVEEKEKFEKMASVQFVSFQKRGYKVETNPNDYTDYVSVTWKEKKTLKASWSSASLSKEKFVYIKFGGLIDEPNESPPKIMKCLTQIDDLDKALRDLREIDRLFAAPTPYFKCETKEEAKDIMTQIVENPNFRIKKMIASTAEFTFVGVDTAGVENLIEEILTLTKMISGTTGVPVHYLGLIELLKNRATGVDSREAMMSGTKKEWIGWVGGFYEMIRKGMNLWNEEVYPQKEGKRLDPKKIGVEIPRYTQEQWDHIEKVLIPASVAGIISQEYVRDQIPGVDPKMEEKRKVEADNSALAMANKENEDLRLEHDEALALLKGGKEVT